MNAGEGPATPGMHPPDGRLACNGATGAVLALEQRRPRGSPVGRFSGWKLDLLIRDFARFIHFEVAMQGSEELSHRSPCAHDRLAGSSKRAGHRQLDVPGVQLTDLQRPFNHADQRADRWVRRIQTRFRSRASTSFCWSSARHPDRNRTGRPRAHAPCQLIDDHQRFQALVG